MKKGQITIFVIVGIFVLMAAAVFFFLAKDSTIESVEDVLPAEIGPVKLFVDSCLKKTVREGVIEIGRNGGYYRFNETIPNFHLKPYYFYEGQVLVPSLELVENQLELYVEQKLPYCTDWFKALPEFDVKINSLKANAKILPEKVIVGINYPLEVNQKNQTTELSEFKHELNTRLGTIHLFLETYFIENQVNEPEGIIVSEFNKLSEDGFYYYFVDNYAPDFTFILVDNEVKVDYLPFYFEFAVRYKLAEIEPWVE
jgi:hypothetical protein